MPKLSLLTSLPQLEKYVSDAIYTFAFPDAPCKNAAPSYGQAAAIILDYKAKGKTDAKSVAALKKILAIADKACENNTYIKISAPGTASHSTSDLTVNIATGGPGGGSTPPSSTFPGSSSSSGSGSGSSSTGTGTGEGAGKGERGKVRGRNRALTTQISLRF